MEEGEEHVEMPVDPGGGDNGAPQSGKNYFRRQKLWSSGRVLGSRLEGRGIDPRSMLDRSGVKAMPGSIPAPNPGSFNI